MYASHCFHKYLLKVSQQTFILLSRLTTNLLANFHSEMGFKKVESLPQEITCRMFVSCSQILFQFLLLRTAHTAYHFTDLPL